MPTFVGGEGGGISSRSSANSDALQMSDRYNEGEEHRLMAKQADAAEVRVIASIHNDVRLY